MKKLKKKIKITVLFIIAILMLIMFCACSGEKEAELILRLESKQAELSETLSGLEAENAELTEEKQELTTKINTANSDTEKFAAMKKGYEEDIESYEKDMRFGKKDIGISLEEFTSNFVNYIIFMDYESFSSSMGNEGEGINYLAPYYLYDAKRRSMVLYDMVSDDDYGLYIGLYITYDDDTGEIIQIDLIYDNPYKEEDIAEDYEEIQEAVLATYLMSLHGPMLYSDNVDTMIDEFKKEGSCLDGAVSLYDYKLDYAGTMIIK